MIGFRTNLQDRIESILNTAVGPGSDPTHTVISFDSYLHDVSLEDTPFVVVNVRTAEKAGESEIGAKYDLYMWTVHIYYIDMHSVYEEGETKRNNILSRIEKVLEEKRRLDNLTSTVGGATEYVYDSSISAILFDSSGHDQYYSFISELYLNVYTAKSG